MVKSKSFYSRVRKYGGSSAIIIPKHIAKDLELETNNYVKIIIEKPNGNMIIYKCVKCQLIIDRDEKITECPACGCKSLEELK